MTGNIIINYWIEKAHEDIASAESNFKAKRYQNSVRDCYFACFHIFTALLLKNKKSFKKHKEVRSILHRDYIRGKIINTAMGKHYDWLFENRQSADYRPLVTFKKDQIKEIIDKSKEFIVYIQKLIIDEK